MRHSHLFSGLLLGCLLQHSSAVAEPASKIMQAALPWQNQTFAQGKAEQCMNWTREVLKQACGDKFASLQSQQPWDLAQLGPGDALKPEHADSLAADEFGTKIQRIDALQAGDLVFLQNTYGNWNKGVITHVGIATGDGNYIHRMTSNQGYVRIEPIPQADFQAGLRLKPELCQ
mgnify:FL=1